MRWRRGQDAPDVIDQRGGGGGGGGFGGGRLPIPGGRAGRGAGGLGLVGVLVFLAIQLLGGGGGGGGGFDIPGAFPGSSAPAADQRGIPADQDPDAELADFSGYVFTNAQNFWIKAFVDNRRDYERAKMVLYRSRVSTACGAASSAVGPFYCPGDQRVYLDLSFYGDMKRQLEAPGDFAWAYVIAHEVGHHVQRVLGTAERVDRARRTDPGNANALSVRLELQADCYSGVWAHSIYKAGDLEEGDVEEAMTASEAVGDDRLQRRSTGGIDPDSFTHGTSAQRLKWFNTGRENGDPGACDTFSVDEP
jgi:predicted metalloprotease